MTELVCESLSGKLREALLGVRNYLRARSDRDREVGVKNVKRSCMKEKR